MFSHRRPSRARRAKSYSHPLTISLRGPGLPAHASAKARSHFSRGCRRQRVGGQTASTPVAGLELVTELFVESMMIVIVKLPSALAPTALQALYHEAHGFMQFQPPCPPPTVAALLMGWPASPWSPTSSRPVPLGLDPPEGFCGRDDLGPLGPLQRSTELPGGQMPVEMRNIAYGFATAGKVHKPSEQ